MSERTRQTVREQDDVFNDETCRALRQQGADAVRLLVPALTFMLFCFVAALQGVLSILGPWMEVMVGVVLSVIFAVTFIAELRWFGISFYRETLRKMKQDFIREARAIAGDPQAIESQIEDPSEPSARPELAFGLPPEECLMIFGVSVGGLTLASSVTNLTVSLLLLGGSIVLSSALFVTGKRSDMNTYPPEEPPHVRD